MRTLNEIREDLRILRIRNENKRRIGSRNLTPSNTEHTYSIAVAEITNKRLKDVFNGLYVDGNTQKQLADKWQVTEKYVQILNKRLLLALQELLPNR